MRHELEESKLVHGLNEVKHDSQSESASKPSKRKGPKAPNPLSVKKRQRPGEEEPKGDGSGKKRRKRGKSAHRDDGAHSEPETEQGHSAVSNPVPADAEKPQAQVLETSSSS